LKLLHLSPSSSSPPPNNFPQILKHPLFIV
jgi:hypothetical protein